MNIIAALLSVALASVPQTAPSDQPPTELRPVVVEGRRLEEAARAYVEQVGGAPRVERD